MSTYQQAPFYSMESIAIERPMKQSGKEGLVPADPNTHPLDDENRLVKRHTRATPRPDGQCFAHIPLLSLPIFHLKDKVISISTVRLKVDK